MDDEYRWEPEAPEEKAEDEYVEQAKPALMKFFDENKDTVFYLKQLQVLFEKPFFHWVTARALYALDDDGLVGSEITSSEGGTRVRLFFRRGYRYRRRQASRLLEIIDEMSKPEVGEACGEQADVLFYNALMGRRFLAYGQDIREFRGTVWEETERDLDFIIERDDVAYGCEVKNRWDYISRDELELKLRMCAHLGVRPLFIMRASPKTYNKMIIDQGGYTLIFVAHLYAFGMGEMVKMVRDELGLEADSPRAIPAGIIDRFMKWHLNNV